MAKRYRVLKEGVSYPDPEDLATIKRVGGRRNLSQEQHEAMKQREIWPKVGDIRDDIPAGSRSWLLDDGYIEEVAEEPKRKKKAKKSTPTNETDGDE